MNTNEKLAVLTALKKLVETERKAVRAEADEKLLDAYEQDGVKQVALKVGGIEVGTFTVVFDSDAWNITDQEDFEVFALEYGFASIERTIKPEYMQRAIDLLYADDPDGIDETVKVDPNWQDYVSPDGTYLDSGLTVPGIERTGRTVKGTMVSKCEPKTVAPILRKIGGVETLLLEGDAQ